MSNLREDLKKNKPILGLKVALKRLRNNKVSKVYVASNSHAKDQLFNLGKSMGVEVVVVEEPSNALGILCKKSYSVSVISFE